MIDLNKTEIEPTEEDIKRVVENLYNYAADLYLNHNYTWSQVRFELMKQGLSSSDAETIVENLQKQEKEAKNKGSNKLIRNGALWCGGGLFLTIITGGQYLFWGAIVYGGYLLIKGIYHKSFS